MSENDKDKEVSEARQARIKALVEEVRSYSNPEELETVKKEIRKNVPLTMRGYFMAYLFVKSRAGRQDYQNTRQERRNASKPAATQIPDSVSLYINVGKISKSSPKELSSFICETASIGAEDVLSIAFKQNFSFVYISKEKAASVIEAVNGKTFNGRKVKISYSRDSNGSAD